MLVQNLHHLPFGPSGTAPRCLGVLQAWQQLSGILCVSSFVAKYMQQHALHLLRLGASSSGINGRLQPLHVVHPAALGAFVVTMLKLTVEKGSDIFLALANQLPNIHFRAVCADAQLQRRVAAAKLANVTLLPPAAAVSEVLVETSLVMVPSILAEAFGLVVVDSMLRGLPVIVADAGALPEAAAGAAAAVLPVQMARFPVAKAKPAALAEAKQASVGESVELHQQQQAVPGLQTIQKCNTTTNVNEDGNGDGAVADEHDVQLSLPPAVADLSGTDEWMSSERSWQGRGTSADGDEDCDTLAGADLTWPVMMNGWVAAVQQGFVGALEQQKPDDGWLEQVQAEAAKLVTFLDNQREQWIHIAAGIDDYVESVRELADTMAINGEADLPENKAKTVHPELVKFQLEKKAKILGRIGGVPALGPAMAGMLPKVPKAQVLKATASPAAREIYYSKVEDKDAANLAGVFQFRKASEDDVSPVTWQEEAAAKNVRRACEAAAAELRQQEEQEQRLSAGGAVGAELARKNMQQLQPVSIAGCSSIRGGPGKAAEELQTATPELAGKLKQRQTELENAQRLQRLEEEEAAAAAAGDLDQTPGWSNSSAPFGSELACLLAKRRQSKDVEEAAKPVKADPTGGHSSNGAATAAAGPAVTDELAMRLKQRQAKLEAEQRF
eukprot:gene3429-3701_t